MTVVTTELDPEWLTSWALRVEVTERGREVSHDQLHRFAEYGLIDRLNARFAPDSADKVIKILEAEAQARSLPRRVVRLRGNYFEFPVPAAPLRQSVIEFAPTIPRPAQKMAAVAGAWNAMASRGGGRSAMQPLPVVAMWPRLIEAIPIRTFEDRTMLWYTLASNVLPPYGREVDLDLEEIPLEERVVIVAILDSSGLPSP